MSTLQCCWSRLSKFHHKPASPKVSPELLRKQHLDIRFVVNHENEIGPRSSPPISDFGKTML